MPSKVSEEAKGSRRLFGNPRNTYSKGSSDPIPRVGDRAEEKEEGGRRRDHGPHDQTCSRRQTG